MVRRSTLVPVFVDSRLSSIFPSIVVAPPLGMLSGTRRTMLNCSPPFRA